VLPEPYFDDGQVTIYCGDARDILPALQPESVDLIATDPPYGVDYVTARRSRSHHLVSPVANDDSLNILCDVLPMLDRALADNRHIYAFAAPTRIGDAATILADFWQIKNLIVWDKGDAGTVGDLDAGYGVNWEAVIYASKGRRPLNGKRPRCVYRYEWSGTRDPVHPTVKPVGLMSWLIAKSSNDGELVLDPFMGSGPTLRAARDLGRRVIGIELREDYCEIAVKRLQQAVLPLEIPA
jgi:site-specific DNA-methyltransferase (adenine-specific)